MGRGQSCCCDTETPPPPSDPPSSLDPSDTTVPRDEPEARFHGYSSLFVSACSWNNLPPELLLLCRQMFPDVGPPQRDSSGERASSSPPAQQGAALLQNWVTATRPALSTPPFHHRVPHSHVQACKVKPKWTFVDILTPKQHFLKSTAGFWTLCAA